MEKINEAKKYYKVTAVSFADDFDVPNPPHTTYIAASDDADYQEQLERALWRAEEHSIKELTFEEYTEEMEKQKKEKEYRETRRYMRLYW